MTVQDYLRVIRSQFVVIVAAAVIGVSIGALVAFFTPQRYDAATEVMVTVKVSDSATPAERAQATGYAQQVVETYRSVITSSLVLDPVDDDLDLPGSTAALASRVQAGTKMRSTIITISVSDSNPGQAARIANAIGDSFSVAVSERLEKRETDTAYAVEIVTLQPAQVPISPVAPNMRLSLLLGALLGLAAGVGLAMLRSVLDQRVRGADDAAAAVDAPVLASIPLDPNAAAHPLVVHDAPRSTAAEAFRSLRTNVRFLFRNGRGVFVITSSGPSEGKTTTAANLALAFADAGHRVALLDGDLRLPRVADYFGLEGGAGLSDVLAGRVDLTDVLQPWGHGRLFVLPAGTVPPNPAELLGSHAMEDLVGNLSRVFDVVIIDAPPLLLVTDAAVSARFATGAILIAASGTTTSNRLADAAKRIDTAEARLLGTVVTMVPLRKASRSPYGDYAASTAS